MKRKWPSIVLAFFFLTSSAWAARLKDISAFKGIRNNQLIGYGLVVGLNGTGDDSKSGFMIRSVVNMLERMGIHVDREKVETSKVKNVATVMVTATLPPFSRTGSRIDVTISSVGDAKNLQGGTLLLTPLKGADQQVYVLAQGPVATGGFAASGSSGTGVQKNHPTVGTIPKGGIIEKEVPVLLDRKKELTLCLFNPDFSTVEKVKETINRAIGEPCAKSVDSGTLSLIVPESYQGRVAEWIASIEKLEVLPDMVAKVILNEKTGTVIMGEHVRISTVAVAHGNLSIQIKESLNVSQPLPFTSPSSKEAPTIILPPEEGTGTLVTPGGATVVTPESSVSAKEEGKTLMVVPTGVSLGEVIRALNAIGATPRDLIVILQGIKAAGALQADLEII